ncbi:MAG TPA: vWA domain-containing protein [Polyangiales bacterium]
MHGSSQLSLGNAGSIAALPAATGGSGALIGTDNPNGVLPMATPIPATNPGSCNQDVDIVFSLDVSGSMGPPLTKLDNEVMLVDAALATKNLPSPPHYGLVIFVDDVMVMNNGMAYPTLDALRMELANQISMTSANSARQVDPNGPPNFSWPENSLDSLYAAATQYQWRPDATTLRTVIHITDASFWDKMVVSSGAMSEAPGPMDMGSMHGYAETVAALRAAKIWVNTFTAMTGGPPDGMMSPPSHGQFRGTSVDVGKGFDEPYAGMPSIPMATGGFSWDIDDVYDGKISLATPINMSIEAHQCAVYPLN